MKFYRGPWQWDSVEKAWNPPAGFSGIDLRNATEQATAGGTPGLGLFFGQGNLPSEYDLLGDGAHRDVKTSARLKNLLPARKGYSPKGNDLLGLIWDALTDGADPGGDDFAKPLMPGVDGRLALHCGQSHYERFTWGDSNVKALLRKDFARLFKESQDGKLKDKFQHLRVLDFWCEQYGLNGPDDWKELVPAALQKDVPGRMRHETTITDDFNRANSSGLGTSAGGWSWTTPLFNWNISSNKAVPGLDGAIVRADSDLSSSDHYSQFAATSGGDSRVGPTVRFAAAADTWYQGWARNNASVTYRLRKRVAGTSTNLTDVNTTAFASGTLKTEINGSSLRLYKDGVSVAGPTTDTAITSNLRCGMGGDTGGSPTADDFQAADLSAGGGIIYTQLERNSTRGYVRGMWTGGI